MILNQVLHHDLHKSNKPDLWIPWIEYGGIKIPCIISGSKGKFLIVRKYHPNEIVRAGTFKYPIDSIDDVLDTLMDGVLDLSKSEKWPNVFSGRNSAKRAFDYIYDNDNDGQPHLCLVPFEWTDMEKKKFFGKSNLSGINKYRKYCKIVHSSVTYPVFCSRPDMVGQYTQIVGGTHSILIHNPMRGLAFCVDS